MISRDREVVGDFIIAECLYSAGMWRLFHAPRNNYCGNSSNAPASAELSQPGEDKGHNKRVGTGAIVSDAIPLAVHAHDAARQRRACLLPAACSGGASPLKWAIDCNEP